MGYQRALRRSEGQVNRLAVYPTGISARHGDATSTCPYTGLHRMSVYCGGRDIARGIGAEMDMRASVAVGGGFWCNRRMLVCVRAKRVCRDGEEEGMVSLASCGGGVEIGFDLHVQDGRLRS